MRIQRLIGPTIALAVIGGLGGGIYYRIAAKAEAETAPGATPATTPANGADTPPPPESVLGAFNADVPIAVEAAPVVRETMVLSVKNSGQARSPMQVVLSSQVSAPVKSVLVEENSFVQAGQVLVELDAFELELSLKEAEANLARAQRAYDRLMLDTARMEPAARAQYIENARVQANLPSAEISLQRAQKNLEKTKVVAPFPGRVANLRVVEGQYVGGGTELLTVLQLDPMWVDIDVLEGDVGLLERGRGGDITFPSAIRDEVFRGRIIQLNPVVDVVRRMGRVTLEIPNPQGRILPGMYARASLDAKMLENRTMVPRSAILQRQGRKLVFLFEPDEGMSREVGATGRAMWQYVATGFENDTHVELIEDPLDSAVRVPEPGEWVLTAGHTTLVHQGFVRITDNAPAAGGRPR